MHHTVSNLFPDGSRAGCCRTSVHHPCNCSQPKPSIEQMRFSIFFFLITERPRLLHSGIHSWPAVVFDDFSALPIKTSSRRTNSSPILFSGAYRPGRTCPFPGYQIFLFTGRPLKRSAFVARAFPFFREAVISSARPQDPPFSASLKVQAIPGRSAERFRWKYQRVLRRVPLLLSRLSRSCVRSGIERF